METLGIALVIGLLLASLIVWGEALRRLWVGQPLLEWRERRPGIFSPAALVLVLLWLAANQFTPRSAPAENAAKQNAAEQPRPVEIVQTGASVSSLGILILLGVLAGSPRGRLADFGIELHDWPRQAGIGVLAFLASWFPVLLALVATSPLRGEGPHNLYLQYLQEDPSPELIAWIGFAAIVLAPLSEELMFRVILQGALEAFLPAAAAIGIVALVFSFVHPWPDSLPLIPLSVILGYTYYRRRSYVAVVVMHALFNLTNLAMMLLAPDAPAAPAGLR